MLRIRDVQVGAVLAAPFAVNDLCPVLALIRVHSRLENGYKAVALFMQVALYAHAKKYADITATPFKLLLLDCL